MPGNWRRSLKKVDAVNSIARFADQGIDPAYNPATFIPPPSDDDSSAQHSQQTQQTYGNGQNVIYFNPAPDAQSSFSSTSNAPAHQHVQATPSQNFSHAYSGPPQHTSPTHTTPAMYNAGPVNSMPVYHHGPYASPTSQSPPAAYDSYTTPISQSPPAAHPYATPMPQSPPAAYNPHVYQNTDYFQPSRSQTVDHSYSQPQAPIFHRSQTVPIYANVNVDDICPNPWCQRQVHP
jgi:hypothetical protein